MATRAKRTLRLSAALSILEELNVSSSESDNSKPDESDSDFSVSSDTDLEKEKEESRDTESEVGGSEFQSQHITYGEDGDEENPDLNNYASVSAGWVKNFHHVPNIIPFTGSPGLTDAEVSCCSTPLDYYQLFVTPEILQLMMCQTNIYASNKIRKAETSKENISDRSMYATWKPVRESEIKKFLGIVIHMGFVKKPRMKDYWTKNNVLDSSFAGRLLTRDRFFSILSFFHLNDNSVSVPRGQPGHDPLHKIRPLFDHLNKRFKEVYTPTSDVSIDEAMCPWKGRLHFRVYMKDKPVKWGIKLYELCESQSGYIYNFEIMCQEPGVSNKPVEVCMRLMEPLLGKGYTVYADNYYTCPDLCMKMAAQDTMVVGTVRSNRIGMPKDLVQQKMTTGQIDYRRNGNLVAIRYKDKRDVYLLTTKHTDEAVPVTSNTKGAVGVQKMKPKAVVDYIQHMAGVDHSDQLLSYMPFHRKTVKWWRKLAFHLLSVAMVQASIVFNKHRKVRGEKLWKLQNFVMAVCHQMAQSGLQDDDDSNQQMQEANGEHNRLTGRHILTRIPDLPNGKKRYKQCALHYARDRASGVTRVQLKKNKSRCVSTECVPCKKALCVECFGIYHTKANVLST